jgi:monoterpene epsilon-lactone hydrolase
MTPRPEEASARDDRETLVINPIDEPSYVKCTSMNSFLNPTSPPGLTAKEVNATLNLNLGLSINPENKALRKIIRWINVIGVMWWEEWFFAFIKKLPLSLRRKVCLSAWQVYFLIHKRILGRRTGLHPAVSHEYHALTSVIYWGRFFPISIPRMRFSLSQLGACTDNHITSKVDKIDCEMKVDGRGWSNSVTGLYVQSGRDDYVHKKKVIFWLYGGAYLGGDVEGNLSPAEMVGKACGVDVFVASYSLVPEAKFDEIVWDVCLAYHWLVTIKQVDPADIILYGISSGAGLATRLMQMIAKHQRGEDTYPSFLSEIMSPMPSGAVLMCPFLDYTESDPDGSFLQYSKHDLIVNQSVMEVGLPYLDYALGDRRKESSPCYDNCRDLPPLCVVVSEHETVYDQTLLLVNRARSQGVDVTLGVWKYQCHVFCILAAYVPEGRQAMSFCNDWIVQEISKKKLVSQ